MTGIWLAFLGFILILLFLDLGVFHRKVRAVNVREALGWSAVWIALGAWSFQRHTKVQALTAARDSERRELAAADAFPAGNRR